jgi:hypothetical protein
METYKVTNENEFVRMMEKTDDTLATEGIPIHARPLHAANRIWRRFGFGADLSLFVQDREPIAGVYVGDDLTIRMNRWYKQKYGDRLKVDPSKRIPIMIRQDVYTLRIPMLRGAFEVICDPNQFGTTSGFQISTGGKPVTVNVVDVIDELTEAYAKSLTYDEMLTITDSFMRGVETTYAIYEAVRQAPISEAIGDLQASVTLLLSKPPQYGLSKWEALQATEKFLKALITKKGGTYRFVHDLNGLADNAESLGHPAIPRSGLAKIQCSAGVRYGTPTVTIREAVEAHQAALEVCGLIAASL